MPETTFTQPSVEEVSQEATIGDAADWVRVKDPTGTDVWYNTEDRRVVEEIGGPAIIPPPWVEFRSDGPMGGDATFFDRTLEMVKGWLDPSTGVIYDSSTAPDGPGINDRLITDGVLGVVSDDPLPAVSLKDHPGPDQAFYVESVGQWIASDGSIRGTHLEMNDLTDASQASLKVEAGIVKIGESDRLQPVDGFDEPKYVGPGGQLTTVSGPAIRDEDGTLGGANLRGILSEEDRAEVLAERAGSGTLVDPDAAVVDANLWVQMADVDGKEVWLNKSTLDLASKPGGALRTDLPQVTNESLADGEPLLVDIPKDSPFLDDLDLIPGRSIGLKGSVQVDIETGHVYLAQPTSTEMVGATTEFGDGLTVHTVFVNDDPNAGPNALPKEMSYVEEIDAWVETQSGQLERETGYADRADTPLTDLIGNVPDDTAYATPFVPLDQLAPIDLKEALRDTRLVEINERTGEMDPPDQLEGLFYDVRTGDIVPHDPAKWAPIGEGKFVNLETGKAHWGVDENRTAGDELPERAISDSEVAVNDWFKTDAGWVDPEDLTVAEGLAGPFVDGVTRIPIDEDFPHGDLIVRVPTPDGDGPGGLQPLRGELDLETGAVVHDDKVVGVLGGTPPEEYLSVVTDDGALMRYVPEMGWIDENGVVVTDEQFVPLDEITPGSFHHLLQDQNMALNTYVDEHGREMTEVRIGYPDKQGEWNDETSTGFALDDMRIDAATGQIVIDEGAVARIAEPPTELDDELAELEASLVEPDEVPESDELMAESVDLDDLSFESDLVAEVAVVEETEVVVVPDEEFVDAAVEVVEEPDLVEVVEVVDEEYEAMLAEEAEDPAAMEP